MDLKSHTTTQPIAKEGIGYVLFSLILFLIAFVSNFLPWVFFFLFLISIYIFRNPERIPDEYDDKAIISPIDGTITDISKVRFEDSEEFLKIGIKKRVTDSSLVRVPIKSNIIFSKKIEGLCLSKESKLYEKLSKRVILSCKNDFSDMIMVLYAGLLNGDIKLFKSKGLLRANSRFGFLLNGSVELFLPLDTRVKVSLKDRVRAGESVLGYLSYESSRVKDGE